MKKRNSLKTQDQLHNPSSSTPSVAAGPLDSTKRSKEAKSMMQELQEARKQREFREMAEL